MKKYTIVLFAMGLLYFLISCKEKSIAIQAPINKDLKAAAEGGIIYDNHFYSVITDSNITIYTKKDNIYNQTDELLHRGDVIEIKKAMNPDGFYLVHLPDKDQVYYLKEFTGFKQPIEGMRFPMVGIISSKGVYAKIYNKASQRYEKFEDLEIGTTYFFEIQKDAPYINYWSNKLNKPVSGALLDGTETKLSIIQKEDHLKILRKHETTVRNLFKTCCL